MLSVPWRVCCLLRMTFFTSGGLCNFGPDTVVLICVSLLFCTGNRYFCPNAGMSEPIMCPGGRYGNGPAYYPSSTFCSGLPGIIRGTPASPCQTTTPAFANGTVNTAGLNAHVGFCIACPLGSYANISGSNSNATCLSCPIGYV